MSKPIPIKTAETIAKNYGYDQIIIIGREVGEPGAEHVTTYGRNKEHCAAAARIGNYLKYEVMEWTRSPLAKPIPVVEFHQHDWMEGFAAFLDDGEQFNPDSKAFCVLNLGSLLATVKAGDIPAADLPYVIAESMMHEIIHVLEKWAGQEFSEERVEQLLEKYEASIRAKRAESIECTGCEHCGAELDAAAGDDTFGGVCPECKKG